MTLCIGCTLILFNKYDDHGESADDSARSSIKSNTIMSIAIKANLDKITQEAERKNIKHDELSLSSRSSSDSVKSTKVYIGEFTLTAYCPCAKCCGAANNKCANGQYPKEGITIASDWNVLPEGTRVYIDGIGERVVHDKGGAIKKNKIDVYFSNHQDALNFGKKTKVGVYIIGQ